MAKVLRQNAILGGQEFKAGTKENDLPDDVRKMASQFLIEEKKYKSDIKPDKAIDADIQARIAGLESQLEDETARSEDATKLLSEANSSIAGLESQLEDETARSEDATKLLSEANSSIAGLESQLEDEMARSEDAETKLSELEAAIVDAGGSVVIDEDTDGGKVSVETAKEEKPSKTKDKR